MHNFTNPLAFTQHPMEFSCWGAVKYSFMLISPSPTRESASAGHFQPPNGPFLDIVREEDGGCKYVHHQQENQLLLGHLSHLMDHSLIWWWGMKYVHYPQENQHLLGTPKPPNGPFLDMVRGRIVHSLIWGRCVWICPSPTGESPKPPYSPTSYGEGGSFLDMVRGMVVWICP